MPDLLDTTQSSKFLNLPRHTLYRAVARGAIGHWRVGQKIMFTKADLLKLVRYVPPRKAN